MTRLPNAWPLPVAAALYLAVSFHFWWFLPAGDEAIHLYNAWRLRAGEWPFRDTFAYVTPGTYLAGAGVLALAGDSIPVLRAVTGALGLAAIVLVDRMLRQSGVVPLQRGLVLLAFVAATALTATIFSHHNVDNFLFVALLALARDDADRRRWFALGTVVALDAFVHQSHGAYFFIACAAVLVTRRDLAWRERALRLAGFALPSALLFGAFGLWLLDAGALQHFADDAVTWPARTYRRELAFGPFEDNVHAVRHRVQLLEQVPLVTAKLIILGGVAWLAWRLWRDGNTPHRLRGWIVVAATLGHLQTLHNGAAYYALACLALWPVLALRSRLWTILLIACCSLQIVRVTTHPLRYPADYLQLTTRLHGIGTQRFYDEPRLRDLDALMVELRRRGIDRAIVVGRSPELYFLGNIRNPARHDVLIPIYLDEARISGVLPLLDRHPVIDDGTRERLRGNTDFFDDHHYIRDGRLARFEGSALYAALAGRETLWTGGGFTLLAPR